MSDAEEKSYLVSEDDLLEADEVEWKLRVKTVDFSTSVVLPRSDGEGTNRRKAKERAREELIEALESGKASIVWKTSTTTRDDQEYTLELQQSCERCSEPYPDASHLREIDTESDDYDPDFEHDHRYALVCEDCRKAFWTWPDDEDEDDGDEADDA